MLLHRLAPPAHGGAPLRVCATPGARRKLSTFGFRPRAAPGSKDVVCFKTEDGSDDPAASPTRLPDAEDETTPLLRTPPVSKSEALSGQKLDAEILSLAFPALVTLAADPLASLVSTVWVGRLGTTELAGVGVALSVYGLVTKLLNMPLLAVTTSSVASALGREQGDDHAAADGVGSAVSAAVVLATGMGLVEAGLLWAGGIQGLSLWGAGRGSALHAPALSFLAVRAAGAPATALFLALQGACRGLGDTRAPLLATVLANAINVALEPVLIFWAGWGVAGAAVAVTLGQLVACAGLLALLRGRCRLRPVGPAALAACRPFLRPTGLLTLRTLAISTTFAMATSLAARTGATHAAAHQICFQVWLASSLLADSLAVAAQTLLARRLAAGDKLSARRVGQRTVPMALWLGAALGAGMAAAGARLPGWFTRDAAVLAAAAGVLPAVVATQPISALAFLMDGILYGAGGFGYAARAMVAAALPAMAVMRAGAALAGGDPALLLAAVWGGLGTVMALRFATIFVPYKLSAGPFAALRDDGCAADGAEARPAADKDD